MQFELTITPLQQRIIAIALALLPIVGVLAILGSFVAGQVDHHARVSMLTRELAREQAFIKQSEKWEQLLSHVKYAPSWQGLFVPAPSIGQPNAAAQLISNAGGAVERSETRRMETSGATELDEFVVFKADIGKLTQILAALRKHQPLFVVRRLSIQDVESRIETQRSAPNALHVELTVAEFVRP